MFDIKDYLTTYNELSEISIIGPLASNLPVLSDPILFVDAGAKYRIGNIGFSVGDGDSSDVSLDQKLPMQKDYSDLQFALSNIPENFKTINMYGFLGARKDHEIINLGEVSHFASNKKNTIINLDREIFCYSSGEYQLKISSTFSLFSFMTNEVLIEGNCKYKFEGTLKQYSSHGLSNVGDGTIMLSCSEPILVFINKEE